MEAGACPPPFCVLELSFPVKNDVSLFFRKIIQISGLLFEILGDIMYNKQVVTKRR